MFCIENSNCFGEQTTLTYLWKQQCAKLERFGAKVKKLFVSKITNVLRANNNALSLNILRRKHVLFLGEKHNSVNSNALS